MTLSAASISISPRTSQRPFFFVWQEAVRKARNLQPTTKALLFVLSTYGNMEGGSIFPSQHQLAEDLEIHETNVRKHLRLAEQAGFVVSHRQQGPRGPLTNLYELTLPSNVEATRPQPAPEAPTAPQTPTAPQEPTEDTENLRRLWRLFLGAAPFPERAVVGRSLAEVRTALAWTLYRRLQGLRKQGGLLRNPAGYSTRMLHLMDQGQVQARPYSERDLQMLVERGVRPDQLRVS